MSIDGPSPVPTVARGGRVEALDVLRGIAILGTLASNIWIFTSFSGHGGTGWLADVSSWIPNGKFLGLLTIMFGIGLEIQRQAAIRQGKKWPGTYPIRAGLLFLDGLLNYIFVVQFDVLRAYAVTGLIVAFLLLTSERVQWWLIGVFLTLHFAFLAFKAWQIDGDGMAMGKEIADPGTKPFPGSEGDYAFSYWDNVVAVASNLWEGFSLQSEFSTIVIMGIALFLLGAKLYRIGIFTPERRALRYIIMGGAFLIALPLDFLISISGFGGPVFSGFARYGAAAGVALGILALVAEFYQHRGTGFVGRHLAFVGKMALSCYLLQNIIGVVYQYTLGNSDLLAEIDNTLITYALFIVISLVLIVFAKLWLRRFPRGPFELAWNWSYRKIARE